MRILHICVTGPYTDGFNYQENLLTKYQVKASHEVHILASEWQWGKNGKIEKHEGNQDYKNADGVIVHRLKINREKDVFYRYKRFEHFYEEIEEIVPDVIFVHNLQFLDIDKITKYARKHKVKIYADNHADFSNSARSKELQNYDFWGFCDIDLIWGDIRKFITDEILEKYDRVLTHGHCSLFKNTQEVNKAYRTLDPKGGMDYKKVFSTEKLWAFDEWALHNGGGYAEIQKRNNIAMYDAPIFADIQINRFFYIRHWNGWSMKMFVLEIQYFI